VVLQEPLSHDLSTQEATNAITQQLATMRDFNKKKTDGFVEALIDHRVDLRGLPFAMGAKCRTVGARAKLLGTMAKLVRLYLVETANRSLSHDAFWANIARTQEKDLLAKVGSEEQEVDRARVAVLVQELATESTAMRVGLVQWLSGIPVVEATHALAKLALFDNEEEVRRGAVAALKVRAKQDYTTILLQGFRYPLPAVAKRAAQAVIALDCQDLVPQLVDLVNEADPRLPVVQDVKNEKATVVRELVRINHHRNCALCHAPAAEDSLRGGLSTLTAPVPLPNLALGNDYYLSESSPGILVRFDITYLRQDFSLLQPVKDAHPWPEMQRFDFLVRTRVVTAKEAQEYQQQFALRQAGGRNPYRQAVLLALRELTGCDAAPTAEAWRKLLDSPKN
jgi:hypothetical protein